jgi:hypothetical protein
MCWHFWEILHRFGIHHYDVGTDGCQHEACELCGEKNAAPIPRGSYCYTGRLDTPSFKPCPYWCQKPGDRYPKQANGYCRFMGKGDIEINQEKRWTSRLRQPDGSWLEDNTLRSADEMGEQLSLLWDR